LGESQPERRVRVGLWRPLGLPSEARGHAESLTPIIARLDPNGSLSLRLLAAKLRAEGLPTPAGAAVWTAVTVARVKANLAA
jgi:hypothetical protein